MYPYTDLPVLSITEKQLLHRVCGVEPKQSNVVLVAYVSFLKDAHHGIPWRSPTTTLSSFATLSTGPRWTRLTLEIERFGGSKISAVTKITDWKAPVLGESFEQVYLVSAPRDTCDPGSPGGP